MSFNKPLLAIGLLFSLTALNAEASLTAYNAAGNTPVVYSSVSDVTWTQDANLFKTLYDADNTLVSQIAAVTPSYNDPSWGLQTIDADDFNTADGGMTWWGSKAFVNYLNSINYAGSTQWALPIVGSNPQFGYNQTGSELGQLFYSELGGVVGNNIPDTANFTNEKSAAYWLATEYAPIPDFVWHFNTGNGSQNHSGKRALFYAWAVSPGQVPAVPVPGAVWLFGTGLMGWLSLKRRGHTG